MLITKLGWKVTVPKCFSRIIKMSCLCYWPVFQRRC